MRSKLADIENRIFTDSFSVFLTEAEYELVRPVVHEVIDESDVFMHGGYDPLSGATITINHSGRDRIKEILCGRPRERDDDISSHLTFNTSYPRNVTIDDIVELYATFNRIEFSSPDDLVVVYELIRDWMVQIQQHMYTSIGYKGLKEEDSVKLQEFIGAIEGRANAINIRNLGNFNSMDGAWANIERMLFHKNLAVHDPRYLQSTFTHEFRMADNRPKVLTKGRIVVPTRVTEGLTDVSEYRDLGVRLKEE